MRIVEYQNGSLKANFMLSQIPKALILIPFEAHGRLWPLRETSRKPILMSIQLYVQRESYWKNSLISGAPAAPPGMSPTPKPSIISRSVLSC